MKTPLSSVPPMDDQDPTEPIYAVDLNADLSLFERMKRALKSTEFQPPIGTGEVVLNVQRKEWPKWNKAVVGPPQERSDG